jgi:hypothetical protein
MSLGSSDSPTAIRSANTCIGIRTCPVPSSISAVVVRASGCDLRSSDGTPGRSSAAEHDRSGAPLGDEPWSGCPKPGCPKHGVRGPVSRLCELPLRRHSIHLRSGDGPEGRRQIGGIPAGGGSGTTGHPANRCTSRLNRGRTRALDSDLGQSGSRLPMCAGPAVRSSRPHSGPRPIHATVDRERHHRVPGEGLVDVCVSAALLRRQSARHLQPPPNDKSSRPQHRPLARA